MNLWLWATIFVSFDSMKEKTVLAVDGGNIHLMKDEIAEALKLCAPLLSSKDEKPKSSDDFTQKATEVRSQERRSRSPQIGKQEKLLLEQSDAIDSVYGDISANRQADEVKLYKGKSYLPQKHDYPKNMKDNSNSSTWGDRRDDPLMMDNDYGHERRFDNQTRASSRNSSDPFLLNNQNNTESSLSDAKNSFNSRGGARFGRKDFKSLLSTRNFKAVRDLNFSTSLFDPYASRGYAQLMRRKRSASLKVKTNEDETDTRGIPKEALLLQRIQEGATSAQARTIARGQLRSCFQGLMSESEDDGCSYSNKLERCMMLQLHERHADMMRPGNTTTDDQ